MIDQVDTVEYIESLGEDDHLISMPRYEPFTASAVALANRGIRFVEVAGGRSIVVQVRTTPDANVQRLWGDVLLDWVLLADPTQRRIALEVPVGRLSAVLRGLSDSDSRVEHIYDY